MMIEPRAASLSCIALASLAVMSVMAACGGARESGAGVPYLNDADYRRATLEESLVTKDNRYARVRLDRYGATGAWERLPEWNPRVQPVVEGDLDDGSAARAHGPLGTEAVALQTSEAARAGDPAALRTLGKEAFFRYPAQLSSALSTALVSRASANRYGLWSDESRGVGGIVRVELEGGSTGIAYTCATCHVQQTTPGARTIIGAPNARLDLGLIMVDAASDTDSARRTALLAWGPGRVDVTTGSGIEPVRIPDLRPTRFLTHLQQSGEVQQRTIDSLAIRIETLLITSHGEAVRPPREVALGLAHYLWSLADSIPERPAATEAERHGATLFAETCSGCHAGPGKTGAPVDADLVGTDSSIARSPDRGTGMYRVASLRGVGSRGPLLHDGSLAGIDAMFDPARLQPSYEGALHHRGPVNGHLFGLDSTAADRADLLAYLRLL